MKKNGFTLIEVLGVIILLGVLSVIVVPVVRDSIKQSKRKAYDKQVNTILTTAREWAADNTGALTEGSFLVKVETLKKEGLLENKDIINPVNNEEMKGCAKVSYNQEFNQYEYEYLDNCFGYNGILSSNDECLKGEPNNCNPGIPIKVQVNDNESYNFYVIADDGNELTMIMDNNLYPDDDRTEGDVGWIDKLDYDEAGGTNWGMYGSNLKGPITALKALKERTKDWTNIQEKEYVTSDENNPKAYPDIMMKMRARMLTYTEASNLGCKEIDSENYSTNDSCPDYLLANLKENLGETDTEGTKGYWLSSAKGDNARGAFTINGYSGVINWDYAKNSWYGIRPVITVSKMANIY